MPWFCSRKIPENSSKKKFRNLTSPGPDRFLENQSMRISWVLIQFFFIISCPKPISGPSDMDEFSRNRPLLYNQLDLWLASALRLDLISQEALRAPSSRHQPDNSSVLTTFKLDKLRILTLTQYCNNPSFDEVLFCSPYFTTTDPLIATLLWSLLFSKTVFCYYSIYSE